ncbi:hypothetical protein [Kitasatospora sp. NBC_01300]|uniref:hypothetical protein n=1 Tax=Kitasatospora sp. NBC_01300 TaxID=2903574 RepID=UPI002F90B7E6|nr:hypothetical protein OG556_33985 [Kitasatospora sp. NBC_01300]
MLAGGDLFYLKQAGTDRRVYASTLPGKRWLSVGQGIFNVNQVYVKFRLVRP